MTVLDFTVEEINFIAFYRAETKAQTIYRIHDDFPNLDEEMQEIATSVARKLNAMTEQEFEIAKFIPAE